MKVTSAILIFCIIACAYAQTCTVYTCAKATETCGSRIGGNNSYTDCRGDSACHIGLGSTSGICLVPARLGDNCGGANDQECESGTSCRSIGDDDKEVCALVAPETNYLYPGEGCSDDKQCIYDSPYGSDDEVDLCRGGKCKSTKEGDYCNGENQCNYNKAFCGTTRQCTKYLKKGAECFLDDETANGCGKEYDSGCMPNAAGGYAGTCAKLHSVKETGFCKNIDDCEEGLWCKPPSSISDRYGTCTKVIDTATINRECDFLRPCTSNNAESCECTKDGSQKCIAQVRPDGYHDAVKDYAECNRKKGCDGYNCIKDKCKSQACKYFKVSQKSADAGVDCGFEGLCNSAFTLVASPLLAFFALFALFAL